MLGFLVTLIFGVATGSLAEGESPSRVRVLLDEASTQFHRAEVKPYAQTLALAWNSDGPAEDRVEAGVALAHVLWRIHHKPDKARKILAEARALEARPAMPLIELAALEINEGNFTAARKAARAALAAASSPHEARDARTLFARATCEEEMQAALRRADGDALSPPDGDFKARVHEAFELLEPVIRDEPGWREPSRRQIFLALLLDNGPAALRAWQSYYMLLPAGPTPPRHSGAARDFGDLIYEDSRWVNRPLTCDEPGEVLADLLPSFAPGADAAARAGVVRALAGSRLFPEAAALALHWDVAPDSAIRDIILYGRWTDDLSRRLAEEYRRHALGKNYRHRIRIPFLLDYTWGRSSLEKILDAESKKLWKAQHPGGEPYEVIQAAVGRRLAFGCVDRTNDPDYFSYGHIVWVTDNPIRQHGREINMRCHVLDSLVCNSYGDWLNGFTGAGLGGWVSPPDSFIQIRTDMSLLIWDTFTDPDIYRRQILDRMERLRAEDDARAAVDPCGYFPGLALRLFARGNERLLRSLRNQGLEGGALRAAFLGEHQRLVDAARILAHEGRHVFDLQEVEVAYSGDELEFRAKCSEVTFAPDALLAVGTGNIFAPNIGQRNAHGMANARVMRNLAAWMQAHAPEISGLDPARALLPQFDLLTDEQMREAFRWMDPLTKADNPATAPAN